MKFNNIEEVQEFLYDSAMDLMWGNRRVFRLWRIGRDLLEVYRYLKENYNAADN